MELESHRVKSGVIEQPKRWSTKQLEEGLNVT